MAPSKYKTMWLFVMFDLPVKTKTQRRRYAQFRNHLLDEGFIRLQYSVYARFCNSEERAHRLRCAVRRKLPPGGEVRAIHVTDVQFGKMEVFWEGKRVDVEEEPRQLQLF